MSTMTENLGLTKPELTDVADITAINRNWDILDEKLKDFETSMNEVNNTLENFDGVDLSGKADLDENGKIPAEQLPEFSTVDGVTAVLSTNWTEQADGTFAQSVTVMGVETESEVVVDCNLTGSDIDADIAVMEAWGCVNRAKQATNSLTFYCYADKPTVAIPINVVVM